MLAMCEQGEVDATCKTMSRGVKLCSCNALVVGIRAVSYGVPYCGHTTVSFVVKNCATLCLWAYVLTANHGAPNQTQQMLADKVKNASICDTFGPKAGCQSVLQNASCKP